MSLPDSSPDEPRGVLVRRQKHSIYTVMLLVALLAIVLSCLILVIEWSQYGFQWKPPTNLGSATGGIDANSPIA